MKIFQFVLISIALILVFTTSTFAQVQKVNSNPNCKIAVVDSSVFDDRINGIKVLVKAKNSYFNESFYLSDLKKDIDDVKKQINLLIAQNQSINEKYVELQKLKSKFLMAKEQSEFNERKRYSIVVSPIDKKIREKLDEFILQNGYALVMDITETEVIIKGNTENITMAFIKFCNESFEKEGFKYQ